MNYEKPEMSIIVLENEQVIRTSNTLVPGEEGPDDSIEF